MQQKWRHLAAAVAKGNNSENALQSSSIVTVDSDLPGEDSWVFVKKQRVTILIPCIPGTVQSTMPDLEHGHQPGNMPNNSSNASQEKPLEVSLAQRNDEPMSLSPKANIQSGQIAVAKTQKPDVTGPTIEDRVVALRAFQRKKRSLLKFHKMSCRPFRPFEQSSTTPLDKMMRASNLERKIVRAGGLGRWLSSLGLQQFERFFHGKNVNKFQLANLSMEKLRDMGAHAVGPRRKLIHAIECACQPYCFQAYNL